MKATGIVRKIDDVGRIVLPMELRKVMNLRGSEDALEIFTDGDKIILQKYNPSCIFCNSLDDIREFKGSKVCAACIKKLTDLSE
ncbi:MAG: AbrB/MazE/SpoVT family DNA-binding domain-containing protein [Oscillospiraceae bacterium]|jgi:transcriptional pleiotropic regulator of transition state genes|nr:AbrB/MazE/SpoVT family DNA-binding domain-containing protein [Oscillospiraceae bacterium]